MRDGKRTVHMMNGDLGEVGNIDSVVAENFRKGTKKAQCASISHVLRSCSNEQPRNEKE